MAIMNNQNYYELLGVARTASGPEIVQAFRARAMALHPDRNKENPEAAAQFKLVSQAYHTLSDPTLRTKYDATLPEQKVAAPKHDFTLPELWKIVGKLYLDRTPRYTKAVDGLQKSMPIIIEEDGGLLIVGLEAVNTNLIGYLESIEVHNNVKDILTEVYGKPLDWRIITGTTLHDYQQLKEAEDKLRNRKKASAIDINNLNSLPSLHGHKSHPAGKTAAVTPVKMAGTWEELVATIDSNWAATSLQELPQVKAGFALKQLPALAQLALQAAAAVDANEEVQRSVAQVLEHIADLTGIDSGVLGMEYLRLVSRISGL